MNAKRERPSPDQWTRLDAALQEMRDKPPAQVTQSLGREIEKRADTIRTLMQSGWRIRDLAVFFRETAGIAVSATTIQTALRQAMKAAEGDSTKPRAKRPRKQSPPDTESRTDSEPVVPQPPQQASLPGTVAHESSSDESTRLGSVLTQGARKRGQR